MQSTDALSTPAAPCPGAPGEHQIHGLRSRMRDAELHLYRARLGTMGDAGGGIQVSPAPRPDRAVTAPLVFRSQVPRTRGESPPRSLLIKPQDAQEVQL